tara:strand:+ start:521 stop:988 length:468 start_codon:yes stop_codon:yes gene_type:complete
MILSPISANETEQALIDNARVTQYIEQTRNQFGGDDINTSVIKQVGNDNTASIMQSQSASYQAGNFAFIYQQGSENYGAISQHGSKHSAAIWQEGNSHKATINQQNPNIALNADIRQFGSSSDIYISQSGNGQQRISIEQEAYSGTAPPVIVETH